MGHLACQRENAEETLFDEALEGLSQPERQALTAIIYQVRELVPEAEEGRSYGLPALVYRGKPLLGFAATKKHLSVYPFSPAAVEAVRDRLTGFNASKGTIRFTVEQPLPNDVVIQLVQTRVHEIDG
jgi:uncharacterized protein YdhG (YjbR/CyaY superfamily)